VYKPIENYGLIGNMHSAALVAADGAIDWYCFPHFDSPSIFGAILDENKGGSFQIGPVDGAGRTQQFYWPETNVLVTRFFTPDGTAELIDFMPITVREPAPTRHWLIRYVTVTRGTMRLRVSCHPRFNYSREGHRTTINAHGATFSSSSLNLELSASVPLKPDGEGVSSECTLHEGHKATFIFRPGGDHGACSPSPSQDETHELLVSTITFWRKWLSSCTYRGRWRERVERSALVLKLLTFEPTGAIIAAPTTSLPEEIGGGRNWDYRYTWLRDAAFSLYALIRIGFNSESIRFMQWLSDRCRALESTRSLQIMYAADGSGDLSEEVLDHLEGYKQSRPVRIGNAAHQQFQLDIYGELMDSMYLHNKYSSPITYDFWTVLRNIADLVCERWQEPDRGVWEVRGEPQHFLYSKVMCWVALDRAIRLAVKRSFPSPLERWIETRDELYEDVMHSGWSSTRQAFTQSYGSEALDAANLIMPLVFFMAPNDPRFLSTLDAINTPISRGGLASGGLLYRYYNKDTQDGLAGQEATFNMCGFWLVEALTRAGRTSRPRLEEARLLFEKLLTHSNHLGLYSEETGTQGEALGNFPQAITHLALISAAYNLDLALDHASI